MRDRRDPSNNTESASAQWWNTVRDSACVRARSARDISKNMQKYEKLEKIGEGEMWKRVVLVEGRGSIGDIPRVAPRRPATRRDWYARVARVQPGGVVHLSLSLFLLSTHNYNLHGDYSLVLPSLSKWRFFSLSRHLWHRVQSQESRDTWNRRVEAGATGRWRWSR